MQTVDQACLELAATQHWLITRSQALALGLSPKAIGRRMSSGQYLPLYPCVYRIAVAPQSWRQRLLGACLWTRGVASHRSALLVLGLEGYSGEVVEVTNSVTRRTSTERVRIHHLARLPSSDVKMMGAIPTTNPTRILLDVGSVLSFKGLEEALDSALRQRLTSLDRLRAGVERLGGRGSRGPKTLGKLLDARGDMVPTDSALETRLSCLLRRHCLPQPQRQVEVRDERGFIGRLDFAYPELMIAIEVQSYRWHSSRAAWGKDMERLNRLQALGWIVIQVTFEDLERRSAEVAQRIRAAIDLRSPRRDRRAST
jgi:very-short-patch-repair endonuclease